MQRPDKRNHGQGTTGNDGKEVEVTTRELIQGRRKGRKMPCSYDRLKNEAFCKCALYKNGTACMESPRVFEEQHTHIAAQARLKLTVTRPSMLLASMQ